MKKQPQLCIPFTTLAAVISLLAGCGKSYTPPPGSISATVGAQAWQSQFVAGIEPPALHVISLIGYLDKPGDSSQLEIDIVDSLPLNQPDPFLNTSVRYSTGNGLIYEGEPSIGGHGSVTVSYRDTTAHKIIGSFSGVLYNASNSKDSLAIAGGKFSCGYTIY